MGGLVGGRVGVSRLDGAMNGGMYEVMGGLVGDGSGWRGDWGGGGVVCVCV